MKKILKNKGFTLIELLVVIGIIAVLAAVVIIAINPARQFAQARDTQRWANVNAILNAVGQNMADNKGIFKCGGATMALPSTVAVISGNATAFPAGFDIRSCIIPTYISTMPFDPTTGVDTSATDYTTGYSIINDAANGRITVSAVGEVPAGAVIAVTR